MEDELDFSFGIQNLARFRGNCFKQRGCVSMVIRQIPFQIKTFADLQLPPVIAGMAERPRGLVLVTGPTGSGKSTTLAAMIDKINTERRGHIITVEDPIEFIHRHRNCIINQREVGADTKSFASALKYALREDPDVILIGTGSEVSLCVGAYETLKGEGVKARVVSMPSWDLFEHQDQAYRDEVLPPGVVGRVAVEQGARLGWDRYAGAGGAVIAMHTFGASAPAAALATKFGFTPERVLEEARKQAARGRTGNGKESAR